MKKPEEVLRGPAAQGTDPSDTDASDVNSEAPKQEVPFRGCIGDMGRVDIKMMSARGGTIGKRIGYRGQNNMSKEPHRLLAHGYQYSMHSPTMPREPYLGTCHPPTWHRDQWLGFVHRLNGELDRRS